MKGFCEKICLGGVMDFFSAKNCTFSYKTMFFDLKIFRKNNCSVRLFVKFTYRHVYQHILRHFADQKLVFFFQDRFQYIFPSKGSKSTSSKKKYIFVSKKAISMRFFFRIWFYILKITILKRFRA